MVMVSSEQRRRHSRGCGVVVLCVVLCVCSMLWDVG